MYCGAKLQLHSSEVADGSPTAFPLQSATFEHFLHVPSVYRTYPALSSHSTQLEDAYPGSHEQTHNPDGNRDPLPRKEQVLLSHTAVGDGVGLEEKLVEPGVSEIVGAVVLLRGLGSFVLGIGDGV